MNKEVYITKEEIWVSERGDVLLDAKHPDAYRLAVKGSAIPYAKALQLGLVKEEPAKEEAKEPEAK